MIRELLRNLRSIIVHLPLILSDSYAGRDISLNRLVALALSICTVSITVAIVQVPTIGPVLTPALQAILTALVAIVGGNVIKHGIRAWKDKGVKTRLNIRSTCLKLIWTSNYAANKAVAFEVHLVPEELVKGKIKTSGWEVSHVWRY